MRILFGALRILYFAYFAQNVCGRFFAFLHVSGDSSVTLVSVQRVTVVISV